MLGKVSQSKQTLLPQSIKMDERIISFIEDQKVAAICCVDEENKPYCFSCFFAFDKERDFLYFKTSANTKHLPLMMQNPNVAGTVQPDKLNPLAIKGIQFTGTMTENAENASSYYYKKYPFALAMPGIVWAIQLNYIKMTDNTLSFGKKIIWERKTATVEA